MVCCAFVFVFVILLNLIKKRILETSPYSLYWLKEACIKVIRILIARMDDEFFRLASKSITSSWVNLQVLCKSQFKPRVGTHSVANVFFLLDLLNTLDKFGCVTHYGIWMSINAHCFTSKIYYSALKMKHLIIFNFVVAVNIIDNNFVSQWSVEQSYVQCLEICMNTLALVLFLTTERIRGCELVQGILMPRSGIWSTSIYTVSWYV